MARHVVEMIKNRPASDLELINVVQFVFIASEDVRSNYYMASSVSGQDEANRAL